MISSSYFPPNNNNSTSSSSTPQRISEASPRSPNFNSIPTTELLSSAPTRSAFLQSLQRSREREERRDKDFQLERERERDKYSHERMNDVVVVSEPLTSSTNLMSRRRLSSSPSAPTKPSTTKSQASSSSSTPLKPITSATPLSQSKLSSHAFTMSRSSNEDESNNNTIRSYRESVESADNYGLMGSYNTNTNPNTNTNYNTNTNINYNNRLNSENTESYGNSITSSISDFKKKYEEDFRKQDAKIPDNPNSINNNTNSNDLKEILTTLIESHTLSLKNDLQSLQIELIKQSVAQQSSFKTLLETYLPMTGKLMEALTQTRDENERLKMRIEDLERTLNRSGRY